MVGDIEGPAPAFIPEKADHIDINNPKRRNISDETSSNVDFIKPLNTKDTQQLQSPFAKECCSAWMALYAMLNFIVAVGATDPYSSNL